MKRISLFSSVLMLICCWVGLATAQIQIQTEPKKKERPSLSEEIEQRTRGEQAAEDHYMVEFLKLPPKQRIAEWQKGKNSDGLAESRKQNALIALGTDSVPFLAAIVRESDSSHQLKALKLLCDMDRFVSMEDTPLPQASSSIYVKEFNLKGILNRFMQIDGRRIGKEGYDVVMWAAEQTKDKELRFHARQYSGLLDQDLRKLPLNEQISLWKTTAAKGKSFTGDRDAETINFYLSQILIEQAPETLPVFISILQHDTNAYVREQALSTLKIIDSCRFRLRTSALGRKALDVMREALENGNLKPVFTKKEWREKEWKDISDVAIEDKVRTDPTSDLSFIAQAMEHFYGVKVTQFSASMSMLRAIPEMQQFFTYLTDLDPEFLGWEYTYIGLRNSDEIMHPKFRQKIARYYEAWKKFQQQKTSSASN